MAITGIFTRRQPNIGGFFFDAVLEEGDELTSDITEFPIEDGSIGNDHINVRNVRIFMKVGISDNYFRSLSAQASAQSVLSNLGSSTLFSAAQIGAGIATGVLANALGGAGSAIAGLGASIANASYAAGQAQTRSSSALESIRNLQRSRELFTLVTHKATYKNVQITRTARQTDSRNQGGLILDVEMVALRIMDSQLVQNAVGQTAPGDPAYPQTFPYTDLGTVTPSNADGLF